MTSTPDGISFANTEATGTQDDIVLGTGTMISGVATIDPATQARTTHFVATYTPGDSNALSPIEMGAWRGFLNAHAHVIRRLEVELEAEQAMPLANYDVLVQLAEAPDRALRMSELASSEPTWRSIAATRTPGP